MTTVNCHSLCSVGGRLCDEVSAVVEASRVGPELGRADGRGLQASRQTPQMNDTTLPDPLI